MQTKGRKSRQTPRAGMLQAEHSKSNTEGATGLACSSSRPRSKFYSHIIQNRQKMETTQMLISWQMVKQMVSLLLSLFGRQVASDSLWPHGLQHARLPCHSLAPRICSNSWSVHKQIFSSVQSLSRVRLFATPWIAAQQASLSITISRSSLRFMSVDSVMPSSHLILCRPLLLLPPIPPSIRVFQWINSSHEVAKVLELQL